MNPGGVQFDWTINVGQILTVIGFFAAAMAFTARMMTQIALLNSRLGEVETETRKQTEILITMAETKVRLDNIEKRADERVLMINQRLLSLEQRRLEQLESLRVT